MVSEALKRYREARNKLNSGSSSSGGSSRIVKVPKGGGYNIKTGDVVDKSGEVVSTREERDRSRGSSGGRSRSRSSKESVNSQEAEVEMQKKVEIEQERRQAKVQNLENPNINQEIFMEQQRRGLNQNFGSVAQEIIIDRELLKDRSRPSPSGTFGLVEEPKQVLMTQDDFRKGKRRQQSTIDFLSTFTPATAVIRAAQVSGETERIIIDSAESGVPLYPHIEQESTRMASLLAAGALGGIQKPFSAARGYDKASLEALKSKPLNLVGVQTQVGDDALVKLVGTRTAGGATEKVSATLPAFKTGKNTFSVTGGKGTSVVEVKPFMKTLQGYGDDAINLFSRDVGIFGRGTVSPATKGFGASKVKVPGQYEVRGEWGLVDDAIPVITKVKVKPSKVDRWSFLLPEDKVIVKPGRIKVKGKFQKEGIETGMFGGLTSSVDDLTFFRGGKVGSVRVRPGQASQVVKLGSQGVVKRVAGQTDDLLGIGDDLVEIVGGKGTGLAKESVQQLKKNSELVGGASALGQTALSRITPAVQVPGRTLPAFNPGALLTGRGGGKQQSPQQTRPTAEPAIFNLVEEAPVVRTTQRIDVGVKPVSRPRVTSRKGQRPREESTTDQITNQLTDQQQSQKQSSSTRQTTRQTSSQQSNIFQGVPYMGGGITGRFGFDLPGFDIPNRRRSPQVRKQRQPRRRTPQRFVSQLTGFEAALGLGGRKVREGTFTGFEVTRGSPIDFNAANRVALNAFGGAGRRPVRRRPAARKKVAKKSTKKKKKGNDWINSLY